MVRISARDKTYQRKVAEERVRRLLSLSFEVAKKDLGLARRYVEIAWKTAKKHRIKLGKIKYTFCRRCYTPWTADTVRVRLVTKPYPAVVYKCLNCGAEYRIPYVREKKERRKSVRISNNLG